MIISTTITSTVKIYTDDTKIYHTINEPDKDIPALQLDLNRLSDWANKWQSCFNPEKSEVMHATHSRDRSKPSYSLGVKLKSVESAGLLIIRAVADPRNSGISAKSREIPQKTRNTAKSARNISKCMSAKYI